ncbi:MAG TPA: amidase [Bryobacteraceae bacterium]|nr:amidase [Bryobacteraceae bacterium]
MTIQEAAAALRARAVSSRELTAQCLARIEAGNGMLNAFLTVTADHALAAADRADQELAAGIDRGPFHGIPIALKDVFCTKGIRTTCGSLLFRDYIPDHDSAVTERFAAAGAVLLGKTHMHELAYGVTSSNPHFGPVRNPWNLDRVPGGSSGGSGAAVAADMCFLATGSDTGGSIRVPGAFCNVVGLKPTYGRVSRYGVMPLDFSLDHMGPLTRSVRDAALCLQLLAGRDERDETSSHAPVDSYVPQAGVSIKDLRIGVPSSFYFDHVEPDVAAAVRKMVQLAAGLGARVEVVPVPDIAALNAIGRVILLSEASAVFERYADRRSEFGADVRTLFDQGMLLPATDYVNAQRLRRQFRDQFLQLFQSIDLLVTPTAPTVAKHIGETAIEIGGVSEDFRLATTRLVRGINVIGFPAISIPCGFDAAAMPIGLQLIARPFAERQLLAAAAALEDATDFHKMAPVF